MLWPGIPIVLSSILSFVFFPAAVAVWAPMHAYASWFSSPTRTRLRIKYAIEVSAIPAHSRHLSLAFTGPTEPHQASAHCVVCSSHPHACDHACSGSAPSSLQTSLSPSELPEPHDHQSSPHLTKRHPPV